MPPDEPQQPPPEKPAKPLEQIVEELGLYPIEAYEFIHSGLAYTVQKIHGKAAEERLKKGEKKSLHITGRHLSEGLREFALLRWGMLARTVLKRWNITRTEDVPALQHSPRQHPPAQQRKLAQSFGEVSAGDVEAFLLPFFQPLLGGFAVDLLDCIRQPGMNELVCLDGI